MPNYDSSNAESLLKTIALLHDYGKATPVFVAHLAKTSQMPELISQLERAGFPSFWPSEYAVTHAAAAEVLLCRKGLDIGIASVIGAHHGKPQSGDFNSETIWINHGHLLVGRSYESSTWTSVQDELVNQIQAETCVSINALKPLPQSSLSLLCGLLIMADWIASNTHYYPLLPLGDDGRSIDIKARSEVAIKHLKLPKCWQTEANRSWAENIYGFRFGSSEKPFIPRSTQREVAQIASAMIKPGMMILEAPMGSGKTEAALAAAELMSANTHSGGVFFGLPTQATANALFGRVMDWALRQSESVVQTIQLCHRMATLNPDFRDLLDGTPADITISEESGLEVHSFFLGKKTALLASFVVGTVDQLLMAALCRKHVMLRQLGLAGKVIIIDEVHAYDAYMDQYLIRVLEWLGAWNTPVILLSATLPTETRAKLMDAYLGKRKSDSPDAWRTSVNYPLLTWSDKGTVYQRELTCDGRKTIVSLNIIRDGDRIELLQDQLSEGGCAGVVCNTVARAQSLAKQIKQTMKDTEVILCHARFVMPQRSEIEDRLLKKLGRNGNRPYRMVLIGTQVIEQSLDIDLDVLISDLCPVDLLLQRIGRLHRHDRIRPNKLSFAKCFVSACEKEDIQNQAIYEPYLLFRTLQVLPENVTLPEDIAPLVQRVYSSNQVDNAASEELLAAHENMLRNIKNQENRAKVYRLKSPYGQSKFMPVSLHGLLDIRVSEDDIKAEASVRDSSASIEVLLLQRTGDNTASIIGEKCNIPLDHVPLPDEAVIIARQRLKLPWSLCAPWAIDKTIAELEKRTELVVPEWKHSTWLQGELVLMLEKDGTAELNGYNLSYDCQFGLICQRNDRR